MYNEIRIIKYKDIKNSETTKIQKIIFMQVVTKNKRQIFFITQKEQKSKSEKYYYYLILIHMLYISAKVYMYNRYNIHNIYNI